MKRPATSSIVVFVVIILVTAVIAAAVGLGTDGASAITVGDQTMSAKSVNAELKAFADNEALAKAVERQGGTVSLTNGTLQSPAATSLVSIMVYGMMLDQALSRQGERVTAADRQEATSAVRDGFAGYSTFPRWLRDRLEQRYATLQAASRVAGSDAAFNRLVERAARRTDVTVDPAYGRWAPARVAVVPYPTPFTPQG